MNGFYNNIKTLFSEKKEKSNKIVSTIVFTPTNYSTDLTDKEWEVIKTLFPYGNRSEHHKRSLLNAVFYVEKTGCQWRMLPKDYPPWNTVWSFFYRAKASGLWQKINDEMVRATRQKAGKSETPTYSLIDSQSVKTTGASMERGIDGGKKIKGRKRHIITDTMGNLLAVKVHAANLHDTKTGIVPMKIAKEKYPTIKGSCGDDGYRKTFEEDGKKIGVKVDISKRIKPIFEILPNRWIVERTFGWLNNSRRLSKDYEITIDSAEAFVMISHSRTLLKRLCFS